jgi:muconolactone D-isomerase
MLFKVEMEINIPHTLDPAYVEQLKQREKEVSQSIQRSGKWPHLWRVAGRYANVSIFDVDDVDELHALLSSLPLYPFMDIRTVPLCKHPSAIER